MLKSSAEMCNDYGENEEIRTETECGIFSRFVESIGLSRPGLLPSEWGEERMLDQMLILNRLKRIMTASHKPFGNNQTRNIP
jgi:hypothetical protein